MSTYAKKVLGLSKGNKPRSPLSSLTNAMNMNTSRSPVTMNTLVNMVTPRCSDKTKYDLGHMKNFLERIKTPGEIREMDNLAYRKKDNLACVDNNKESEDSCKSNQENDEIELGEEAFNLNRRLEFGSLGFMSLGGEVPHDHDESVSGKDQQHPDEENVAQKNLRGGKYDSVQPG